MNYAIKLYYTRFNVYLNYIPGNMEGFRNFSFVATSDFYGCFVTLNLTKWLKLLNFIPLPQQSQISIFSHDLITSSLKNKNRQKGSKVTNLLHKPFKKLTLGNAFTCLSQWHVDNPTNWKISHSLCCKAATLNPKATAQLNTINKQPTISLLKHHSFINTTLNTSIIQCLHPQWIMRNNLSSQIYINQ